MHPAFSVIFLTTLIGVGQGLFLALYTSQVYSLGQLVPTQNSQTFYGYGALFALFFMVFGMFAVLFHLGRPERAWRSMAMWRTSWLSREVILLPIVMLLMALFGITHYIDWTKPLFTISDVLPVDLTLLLGFGAAVLVFLLFAVTSMIYAVIKFIPEWHSPYTMINFTLFGLASGFMAAAAFSAVLEHNLTAFFIFWAALFTVMSLVTRTMSLIRNSKVGIPSTVQSAIGIKHPNIRQTSQGSMGGSYNTREFNHGKSESFLKNIKTGFYILIFFVPLVLLFLAYSSNVALLVVLAFISQYIGLLLERWYFFAEASHPQNLYYSSKG